MLNSWKARKALFRNFAKHTNHGGEIVRMSIEELERLAVGQGPDAGTYQHHDGADTSQHLVWYQPTIQSRVMDAIQQGGALMTRRQIADALGLRKTPWLVGVIEQLVSAGYLVKIEARTPQGVIMWIYEVRR
jgi:hypothetical protein